jgi:hypothetical protein
LYLMYGFHALSILSIFSFTSPSSVIFYTPEDLAHTAIEVSP